MSVSAATSTAAGKVVARAASVHIDPACNAFMHDCFRQFGIHVVALPHDPVTMFSRQKFEACVLRLYDPQAEAILKAARNSSSNKSIVIYGIARNTKEALRYSNYGINAIFDEPLDRQSVLKVVRATHLLVIHELRRYVRVPVVAEAVLEIGVTTAKVMTVEVSSGGMSVRSLSPISSADPVQITARLPGLERLEVRAFLCWSRPADKVYGFRFDPADTRRAQVRRWIDQYLEIV
ncbi:MAG TPA: PilZ domain-containing protein [Candidatus Angelobacter sp.]|nr:PilZ domain-containing protein [Candidatus Angelobacter sp.]